MVKLCRPSICPNDLKKRLKPLNLQCKIKRVGGNIVTVITVKTPTGNKEVGMKKEITTPIVLKNREMQKTGANVQTGGGFSQVNKSESGEDYDQPAIVAEMKKSVTPMVVKNYVEQETEVYALTGGGFSQVNKSEPEEDYDQPAIVAEMKKSVTPMVVKNYVEQETEV